MTNVSFASPQPFPGFLNRESHAFGGGGIVWNDNDSAARERLFQRVIVDGEVVFVPLNARRLTVQAGLSIAGLIIVVAAVVTVAVSVLHFFLPGAWPMFVGGCGALTILAAIAWSERRLKRVSNGLDRP